MTEVIVEQPLDSPGSANYVVLVKDIVSPGETLPRTYKLVPWFKSYPVLLNRLISSC